MTTDPKKREPKIPTRKPDISQSQGRGNPSTRHSREREAPLIQITQHGVERRSMTRKNK
jgi:hypothetical protein